MMNRKDHCSTVQSYKTVLSDLTRDSSISQVRRGVGGGGMACGRAVFAEPGDIRIIM